MLEKRIESIGVVTPEGWGLGEGALLVIIRVLACVIVWGSRCEAEKENGNEVFTSEMEWIPR